MDGAPKAVPNLCGDHYSGGDQTPCAWPDCEEGTKASEVRYRPLWMDRIPNTSGRKREDEVWVREQLDSVEKKPRYFWKHREGRWTGIAPQIRNHEVLPLLDPLHRGFAYHYTTLSTFLSIVESGDLWLSDYGYLNDSSEVRYGQDLAGEVFREVSSDLTADEKRLFEPLFRSTPGDQPRICVACFSYDRDSLSQWRSYSKGELAVAIGIDPTNLLWDMQRPPDTKFSPVIYDPAVQRRLLRSWFHDWTQLYRRDDSAPMPDSPPRADGGRLALRYFFDLFSLFKSPAFADEKEARVVYQQPPLSGRDALPVKRFRVAGPMLRPYTSILDLLDARKADRHTIDFSLPINMPPPRLGIREVVVGPHPSAEDARGSIVEFLDAMGYPDTQVTISKVPFRVV